MALLGLLILGTLVQGHLALTVSECGTSLRRPGNRPTLHFLSLMIIVG